MKKCKGRKLFLIEFASIPQLTISHVYSNARIEERVNRLRKTAYIHYATIKGVVQGCRIPYRFGSTHDKPIHEKLLDHFWARLV